jgi:hypothetical protein
MEASFSSQTESTIPQEIALGNERHKALHRHVRDRIRPVDPLRAALYNHLSCSVPLMGLKDSPVRLTQSGG